MNAAPRRAGGSVAAAPPGLHLAHLRPGFGHTVQPAFRCIPDAARVARILSDAAQTRVNEPVVSFAPQSALAAE